MPPISPLMSTAPLNGADRQTWFLASFSFDRTTTDTAMITFVDSMPELVKTLMDQGVDISETGGVFVRDMRGRLVFVARRELGPELIDKVAATISSNLKPYISPIGALADDTTPGASRALKSNEGLAVQVQPPAHEIPITVVLLDRRATGADWIHVPEVLVVSFLRHVFFCLLCGVGCFFVFC